MADAEDILEQLRDLSPWARVAFAARCARRVQPLAALGGMDAEHLAAVERAIQLAEAFATNERNARSKHLIAAAKSAYDAANTTNALTANGNGARSAANAAAYAARSAANAAAYIPNATDPSYIVADSNTAALAAAAAAAANYSYTAYVAYGAFAYAAHTAAAANNAAKTDIAHLKQRKMERKHWQTLLGPLWPNGEPEWFNRAEPQESRLERAKEPEPVTPIELWLEPGRASKETLQEVLVALSELHRAAGGTGLKFTEGTDYALVRERECV